MPTANRRPISEHRRIAWHVAAVALVALSTIEVLCHLAFRPLCGHPFSRELRPADRAELTSIRERLSAPRGDGAGASAKYVFHPYLGFVGRAGADLWGPGFNRYGVINPHPYPYPKQPGEFVVAVTGGSVAELFSNQAEADLQRAMHALGFPRKIVLLTLAAGGYKQPQQLVFVELAELASFGIDAVLNLDGFNEIALASENARQQASEIFPSIFHMSQLAALSRPELPDPAMTRLLSAYYQDLSRQANLMTWAETAIVRNSAALALPSELAIRRLRRLAEQRRHELARHFESRTPAEFRGPSPPSPSDYARFADVWSRSSQMLDAVCRRLGIVYVHALQPNQYAPGSKPLSPREQRIAINPNNSWGSAAREGYSSLIAKGAELKRGGVAFYDLSLAFQSVSEDLYIDDCCHFSARGSQILAEKLAPILIDEIRTQRPDPELSGRATADPT